jgi:hypothetical protein
MSKSLYPGERFTAVARIFCMSCKWDVKLQFLAVSMVTLLIKDFAECELTRKMWLSFWFCVLQPCKISWPQQCLTGNHVQKLKYDQRRLLEHVCDIDNVLTRYVDWHPLGLGKGKLDELK